MPLLADAELLARLVAFDTTSHRSNLPLADFLCDYLERPGVRVVRAPSADGAKVALVASAGPPAGRRRGLVLSGHMDVVPAEEEGWESDPFALADRGDRWVARGACDMKGFLALAANLLAAAATEDLAAPLVLVFTYDEELGALGARRLVESWPEGETLPRSAIIGEPTSLAAARLHKGHLKLRVVLRGRSAHSGLPRLGISAVEPAGRVVGALAALRAELAREPAPHAEAFPEVPYAALNVGTIAGGAAINVVPDRCVVELGIRTLPGMETAPLVERVRRAASAAAAPLVPEVEVISDSPPLVVPEGAPIVRHLCALTGGPAGSVPFSTDAGWLQRLGLDCAVFGPGAIAAAHRPNEWLPKADLARARALLERTVGTFCGPQPARAWS
ncbi:MAG TPA: acetylornithine deacetylase [Thermoanaerobaculia bacterium]|nr:acetylornithine deacetylase [Thermoanaerobaculia bacterium]